MTWETLTAADWDEAVSDAADQLDDTAVHEVIEAFELVPHFADQEQVEGALHAGALNVVGDFKQPKLLTAINGDLTVDGELSTQGVDGFDGNATLVVFGDLTCKTLVNDWASLIIVTGNCTVSDWTYAAREDSSFVVGGDFTTRLFIGHDIWVTVGGKATLGAGDGYALALGADVQVVARVDPASAVEILQIELSDDAYPFEETLGQRLIETGTILPPR